MKTVLQRLIEARDRIADPKHWTKRTFARDASGLPCDFQESFAVCFCSLGAISVVAAADDPSPLSYLDEPSRRALSDAIERETGAGKIPGDSLSSHIARWNDHPDRTHPEVIAMFGKAIAAEKAKVSNA